MHSMKIKRQLPPAPKITTKPVRNDRIYGYGAYTYETPVPSSQIELRIPPQRSNSLAAEKEREMKVILDLAREGKTATQIAEESGYNRNRVMQVVKQFQEYGAKLAPEPPKKKKRAVSPTSSVWTEEMVNTLIELHKAGLSFSEIGKELGVSKNSVAPKVRVLVEAGVLKPRTEQFHGHRKTLTECSNCVQRARRGAKSPISWGGRLPHATTNIPKNWRKENA